MPERQVHPAAWVAALLLHGAVGGALLAPAASPSPAGSGSLVVGFAFPDAPGGATPETPPPGAEAPAPAAADPPPADAASLPHEPPEVPVPAAEAPPPAAPPEAVADAPPPAIDPAEATLPARDPDAAAPLAMEAGQGARAAAETVRPQSAPLPSPPPPVPRTQPPAARLVNSADIRQPVARPGLGDGASARTAVGGAGVATATSGAALAALPPDYLVTLRQLLERNLRFPMAAREQGLSGTVTVRFAVARDGRVLDAALSASSGHTSLDREALALLRRVSPLPPLPPAFPAERADLTLPVVFRLR